MPEHYVYPEGMSDDEKRTFRRKARAEARKSGGSPSPAFPRAERKKGLRIEAPIEDRGEGEMAPERERYEEYLLEHGLTKQEMPKGFGFSIAKGTNPDRFITKFRDRWGYDATTFNFLQGGILVLGPLPADKSS